MLSTWTDRVVVGGVEANIVVVVGHGGGGGSATFLYKHQYWLSNFYMPVLAYEG